uniref:GDP-fucose protein O-fucosyltransferase 2 n=1 Tax=Steinernema glaseri TaxID=37863 RepID=A0A1I7XVM8_9BILA
MKYSKEILELSADFQKAELKDPFMCVHLRRRDFVRSHSKDIPSIEGAAKQILKISKDRNLKVLYLSTDAENHEIHKLKEALKREVQLKRFDPNTVS